MSIKINSSTTSADGTSLKGYIYTTYAELVERLGQPMGGSADGKTTCEWKVEFDDGSVTTIHDWKSSITPTAMYKWSVGAKSHKPLKRLEEVLEMPVTFTSF